MTTPADYTPYCVTAPIDPRLPGGGGYQICDLADISPEKFGQVFTRVPQSSLYGDQKQINDFFAATMNARFGSRARLAGGLDLGRSVTDNCFIVDNAQDLLNCHNVKGCGANAQVKFNGNITLPGNVLLSGLIQSFRGHITASWAAPNSSWRRRWAAISARAGPARRAPRRSRCRSSPPTSCSIRASIDSIFGSRNTSRSRRASGCR